MQQVIFTAGLLRGFWPGSQKADLELWIEAFVQASSNLNLVENLTWDAVAARIAAGASAILPIGAGAKEHGFHLPMNTDRVQAEALAVRVANQFNALIWPTVAYGFYPAFVNYAGSASLSAETFEQTIEEVARSLCNFGCRAVFVIDTGISTVQPVARALSRLGRANVSHLKIHVGARYQRAAKELAMQSYGSHADELETSLMLALALDRVDMSRAEASPNAARNSNGALMPFDASSPNYSPSGSFGDPTLATRAKGEILLAAMIDDLVEQIQSFLVRVDKKAVS